MNNNVYNKAYTHIFFEIKNKPADKQKNNTAWSLGKELNTFNFCHSGIIPYGSTKFKNVSKKNIR